MSGLIEGTVLAAPAIGDRVKVIIPPSADQYTEARCSPHGFQLAAKGDKAPSIPPRATPSWPL